MIKSPGNDRIEPEAPAFVLAVRVGAPRSWTAGQSRCRWVKHTSVAQEMSTIAAQRQINQLRFFI